MEHPVEELGQLFGDLAGHPTRPVPVHVQHGFVGE
ncbi:hypothetical protein H4W79_004569 [Nocardiopsis terrae]|uniref:Uncharacterized protein n=1 Tax=Nocardiopsis terrae TaxID=372655 RepID=A0ABR9HMV7_9ACTN|nr:hypothetical protein [Nocardiopsis terrae]